MTEIIFKKRQGREGEMGLFVDTPVFEDEWSSLKIGSEVKAECTVPANLRYIKFFHALCGKVAENCDWLIDKDDAKERILLEARHAKVIHDPLRNKTEIKAKSVAGLTGDAWIRLLRRCTYVVVTKFIPGMDEGPLKAEIEAMIGIDTAPASEPEPAKPPKAARPKKANVDPVSVAGGGEQTGPVGAPQPNTDAPTGNRAAPTNEAEYVAACRSWLQKQESRFPAFDHFNSESHRKMRLDLKISTSVRKHLEREIGEFFDEKDKAAAKAKVRTDVGDNGQSGEANSVAD